MYVTWSRLCLGMRMEILSYCMFLGIEFRSSGLAASTLYTGSIPAAPKYLLRGVFNFTENCIWFKKYVLQGQNDFFPSIIFLMCGGGLYVYVCYMHVCLLVVSLRHLIWRPEVNFRWLLLFILAFDTFHLELTISSSWLESKPSGPSILTAHSSGVCCAM